MTQTTVSQTHSDSLARRAISRLAITLSVLFLAVSGLSYLYLLHLLEEQTFEQLSKYIKERGQGESGLFELAEDSQQALRNEYVRQWALLEGTDPIERFNELYGDYGDGTRRLDPAYYHGIRQDNSLVTRSITGFIGGDIEITADVRRKMVLLYELMNVYGTAWTIWDNRFINLWFVTRDGMLVEGMPGTPYALNVDADMEFEKEEWAWFADAEHNPRRESVWTTFYFDPTSKKWLVSCATPVYVGDEHAFTIGQDILLDEFLNRAVAEHLPGARNVVFRADGKLIADEDKTQAILDAGGDYSIQDTRDPELARIYELITGDTSGAVVLEDTVFDNYLAVTKIAGPEWHFVTVSPKGLLVAESRRAAVVVIVLGLVALGIALAVLFRVLNQQVSRPLRGFVEFAHRIGGGDFGVVSDPEFRKLARRKDEIGLFTNAFRGMTEELDESRRTLQAAHDQLEHRVEERTRELANEVRERKQAAEALKIARDEADSANRAKSAFLANMSHELRTPMNAILGYSEMLMEEAEDVGQEDFVPDLKRIHQSGSHLLALINDVLDLSKIESGRMEAFAEDFEVGPLIEQVADTANPLMGKNDNQLSIVREGDLGAAHQDLTKVRQSLFNLLSNAAKFTHGGTITLRAERDERADGRWLVFAISDTGIGIAEDKLEHIFEEFSQADASTTRDYGGTGLGLPISRRFCRMLGGDLTVTSRLGEGSTFTMSIPAVLPDAEAQPAADQEGSVTTEAELQALRTSGAGRTVLVIDDDPQARDLLERFLRKDGFEVALAGTGEEGLRLAHELSPAVITLDVMMPGMDGWSVLRVLKADPALRDIPIVLLTMVDEKGKGYAIGATDYLTKPVDRGQLHEALTRYLDADAPGSVLLVEDDRATREMTARTLAKSDWRVAEAANGREALDLLEEYKPGLILLDLMMPVMDGFEFLIEMSANEALRDIPVIVLTAKDLTDEDRRRLSGRVEQILTKGAQDEQQIVSLIHQRLGQSEVVASKATGK